MSKERKDDQSSSLFRGNSKSLSDERENEDLGIVGTFSMDSRGERVLGLLAVEVGMEAGGRLEVEKFEAFSCEDVTSILVGLFIF